MRIFRTLFVGLMVFVAGLNGVFGGSGIATLCIHGFNYIHLASGDHDQEHTECGGTDHCGESENSDNDIVLTSESSDCEEHCTDIELKAVENECPPRTGIEKILPLSFDFVHAFARIDLGYSSRDSWLMPPMRGPPLVNTLTELCIKKTVLRL